MQSRVSINSPVVLNLNKYIIKMVWGRLMYVSNDGIRMYKSNFTALVEYSLNIWLTLDTSPAVTSSELLYIGSIISCSGKEPMKNVRPQGSGWNQAPCCAGLLTNYLARGPEKIAVFYHQANVKVIP